jgi:hypothetical protein
MMTQPVLQMILDRQVEVSKCMSALQRASDQDSGGFAGPPADALMDESRFLLRLITTFVDQELLPAIKSDGHEATKPPEAQPEPEPPEPPRSRLTRFRAWLLDRS